MLTEQVGTNLDLHSEGYPLPAARRPEVRRIPKLDEVYLASPIQFLALDASQRPTLLTLDREMLKRLYGYSTETSIGLIEDRIDLSRLPTAIFRAQIESEKPQSSDNPVSNNPDLNIPVSFPQSLEKTENIALYAELYVYSPDESPSVVSRLRKSPSLNIESVGEGMSDDQLEIIQNYDFALKRNTGLGLLDTLSILSNPESSNSFGVSTPAKVHRIGEILGFPPKEQDLLSTLISRVHLANAQQAQQSQLTGVVEGQAVGALFPNQDVFVSPLDKPWEIQPFSTGEKYTDEYIEAFVKRNYELCLALNQKPYGRDDLRKIFHIGTAKASEILNRNPELNQQRADLFNEINHPSTKVDRVEEYLLAHPELQSMSFQDQKIALNAVGIEASHVLIGTVVGRNPELDKLRKTSRPSNLSEAGSKGGTPTHELTRIENILRSEPSILAGNDNEISANVEREFGSPVPLGRIKRVIRATEDLAALRKDFVRKGQIKRGVENMTNQRGENPINFAGMHFGSAAEAIFGFLVLNYTRNDAMEEGIDFQVDDQLDFVIKDKEGHQVVVEYHNPYWEEIKDSDMETYAKTRKMLLESLGKGDMELKVFEGFNSIEKTTEIMGFIQHNLRQAKDVYLEDDNHIKQIFNLVHKGIGPFIPKTKDEKGDYLYWNKPKAAIGFVLNHPMTLIQVFPDIRPEDMIYYYRDKLQDPGESNRVKFEIMSAYPGFTPYQIDSLIISEQSQNGWFYEPLPKVKSYSME